VLADTFSAGSLRFAFTDRIGGISDAPYDSLNLGGGVGDAPSAVAENRRRVAAAVGLPASRLVFLRQVHGDDVAIVDGPWPAGTPPPQVDAVVTTAVELGLVIVVADCLPVLLGDDVAGVVAAAHVGRRGLAAGLVGRVVDALVATGARPQRVQAYVGPGICGACYEVPAAMHDDVVAMVPEASSRTGRGTPALDIRAGVHAQLRRSGIPDTTPLVDVARCTFEDPALFSHRRHQPTGRLAGIAWRVA
jgi:polyphenol oxidase